MAEATSGNFYLFYYKTQFMLQKPTIPLPVRLWRKLRAETFIYLKFKLKTSCEVKI